MNNFISGCLSKPTNEKIAKHFGVHESTVRSWQRASIEDFQEKLDTMRLETAPFIELENFNKRMNTNYSVDDIKNGIIPAIMCKDSNFLIPTVTNEMNATLKRLKSLSNECNVISISNFKGGVGKTSTSINLAITLSFFGCKVLLVDEDIQGNTTSMFDIYRYKKNSIVDLQIKKIDELYDIENSDFKYTIVDLMAEVENDNIEQMVRDSIINLNDKTKTTGRLDIIPNACDIENNFKFEDITSILRSYGNPNKALDEVLSYVKEDYDFIIIDTPPSISLPLSMAALATDYFIIALTADKMAKDGIAPFLAPIKLHEKAYRKEKGKDIVILGGVLNKFQVNSKVQRRNKELINESLLENTTNVNLGVAELFKTVIKHVNIMNEAQYDTGSILIYDATSDVVRDYFNLAIEIIDGIIIDKMGKM